MTRGEMLNAAVISTGNELVYGNKPDTNSRFISNRLFATNISVRFHIVVSDEISQLLKALRFSLNNVDIVFITGGLGPTDDDNTIEALRQIVNFTIRVDEEARNKMNELFKKIGREMSEMDMKMATVPESAEVLKNDSGLAPGFVLPYKNNWIVSMPGVPGEMSRMFDSKVMPYLAANCGLDEIVYLKFSVFGLKETDINEKINLLDLPQGSVEWSITSQNGIISVTLVDTEGNLQRDKILSHFKKELGINMINAEFAGPESELVSLLISKNLTISTAESCTGGMIGKLITDVPGASNVYLGGVVAYDNSVKINTLNVGYNLLERDGAVSEAVAESMAEGIRKLLGSDIGISVTGIAGPDGGNSEKPVGMVCFGFSSPYRTESITRIFPAGRERVRNNASLFSVDYLRRALLENRKFTK